MSLVPLLFRDWWDDFDRERPSRLLDQNFGLGLKKDDLFNNWTSLSPPLIRPGRYFRPWNESLLRSNSGSSNIKTDEKQFQVLIYNYYTILFKFSRNSIEMYDKFYKIKIFIVFSKFCLEKFPKIIKNFFKTSLIFVFYKIFLKFTIFPAFL